MAINIVESLQKNLGLPELQKIDPNTQEVKHPEQASNDADFYQAALPTVLVGLYKYTRSKDGNTQILFDQTSGRLIETIFGDKTNIVIEKVSSYTGKPSDFTSDKMEIIAIEAVSILKKEMPGKIDDAVVRTFFTDQRNNILKYIPAGLQIGDALNDETLDDKTHKMEGPMSGAMHWIEKLFSNTDPKKEENF